MKRTWYRELLRRRLFINFLLVLQLTFFIYIFTVKQNLPGDPKSADYPYQALKGSF